MTKGTGPKRKTRMTKSHPQDADTRKLVEWFCGQVFWLKQVHYMVRELFHDKHAQWRMERTALAFFQNLNRILMGYFLLEVTKLTDPATSVGKKENLTLANLIETVEWPSDRLKEIEQINTQVQSFRKYIKPARDTILAHYDKTTVLSGKSLGAFPEGKDEELLAALEQICDLFHHASFGTVLVHTMCGHEGDALDLKHALARAIAFDRLLSDSTGDVLRRLNKSLDDVLSSPA
jgi:hypothetical protein